MAKHRSADIQHALMQSVFWRKRSPVVEVAARFDVTRQAVQKHLASLVRKRLVRREGRRPHQTYSLRHTNTAWKAFPLAKEPGEYELYDSVVSPVVARLDSESRGVLYYGGTEMVNNAIDHSGGTTVLIGVDTTPVSIAVTVADDGVGIVKKVSTAINSMNPRDSFLELSKGKFTTDPQRHTGEGLFFTMRAFDRFSIFANGTIFTHELPEDRWIVDDDPDPNRRGTRVVMELIVPTPRNLTELFAAYSSGPEEYRFARTRIPLKLAQIGEAQLISRSQAKRVLARVERFDEVLLDFSAVETVGQAFADEIFRVYAQSHPTVRLTVANANAQVTAMIRRAHAARDEQH